MKVKTLKRRKINNQFPVNDYTKMFVILEAALSVVYVKYMASFSVYGNRMRNLAFMLVIFGLGNYLLSVKRERNWVSLITGTSIPILLFETVGMWKYFSYIRWFSVVGIGISCLAALLWTCITNKKLHYDRSAVLSKYGYFVRIICSISLLIACLCGKYFMSTHYTVSMREGAYFKSENQDDIPDYENSLAANIDTVIKMDPDGGWTSLSADEKLEVLETICRIECRYLGMRDSAPTLELSYLEEGLLGKYNSDTDTITLSYNYVIDTKSSAYSICQVLCHELYHRYQRYQVKMLEAIRNSNDTAMYADLLLLDTVSIYEEEMQNYIAPENESDLSYYFYYSQQLECDADKYGNQAVHEYYEAIQNYYKNN